MPPCGSYNVNYKSMERNFRSLNWTHTETKAKLRKTKVEPPLRLIEMPRDSKGFLDFQRQKARKSIVGIPPHDERFENYGNIPSISTKAK